MNDKVKAHMALVEDYAALLSHHQYETARDKRKALQASAIALHAEQAEPVVAHALEATFVVPQKSPNVSDKPQAEPGFVMVAVKNLGPLLDALDRADRKGYLPDAMAEEWAAFELGPLSEPPKAPVEPVGEREQFEAWCESHLMPAESDWFRREPDDHDEYRNPMIDMAWSAWQARSTKGSK